MDTSSLDQVKVEVAKVVESQKSNSEGIKELAGQIEPSLASDKATQKRACELVADANLVVDETQEAQRIMGTILGQVQSDTGTTMQAMTQLLGVYDRVERSMLALKSDLAQVVRRSESLEEKIKSSR